MWLSLQLLVKISTLPLRAGGSCSASELGRDRDHGNGREAVASYRPHRVHGGGGGVALGILLQQGFAESSPTVHWPRFQMLGTQDRRVSGF